MQLCTVDSRNPKYHSLLPLARKAYDDHDVGTRRYSRYGYFKDVREAVSVSAKGWADFRENEDLCVV